MTEVREIFGWKLIALGLIAESIVIMLYTLVLMDLGAFANTHLFLWFHPSMDWAFPLVIVFIPMVMLSIAGKKGQQLDSSQLGLIYIMAAIGTGVNGAMHYVLQLFQLPKFGGEAVTNGWIPSFWMSDLASYDGIIATGTINWGSVAVPLAYWMSFFLMMVMIPYFMTIILRKRLVEVESLPFPTAMPAVQALSKDEETKKPMFSDRLFIIGLAIGLLWYLQDIYYYFNPQFRPLTTILFDEWMAAVYYGWTPDLTPWLKGALVLRVNLLEIMAYYWFPLDALLTFGAGGILLNTLIPAIGISTGIYPQVTLEWYTVFQSVGMSWAPYVWVMFGWGTILGTFIWVVGSGLYGYLRSPVKEKPISWAWIGLILCTVVLMGLAGVSNLSPGAFAPLLFTAVIWQLFRVRQRAEIWNLGQATWGTWSIQSPISNLFYGGQLGELGFRAEIVNATAAEYFYENAGCIWGRYLEGFFIAKQTGVSHKSFMKAMIVAVIWFVIFAPIFMVFMGQLSGWNRAKYGWYDVVWNSIDPALYRAKTGAAQLGDVSSTVTQLPYLGLGTAIIVAMFYLKSTFVWFPLNPLGLFFVGGWGMPNAYLTALACYAIKFAILKVGGYKLNRRAQTLIIGFAIGWVLIKLIQYPIVMTFVGPENFPPQKV